MMLQWLSTGMTSQILSSNVHCSRACEGQSRLAQSTATPTHDFSVCLDFSQSGSSILGLGADIPRNPGCVVFAYLSLEFMWHPFSPVLFSQYSSGSRREMTSLPSLYRRLARSRCITTRGNEITRCDRPSKLQPATRTGQNDGLQ